MRHVACRLIAGLLPAQPISRRASVCSSRAKRSEGARVVVVTAVVVPVDSMKVVPTPAVALVVRPEEISSVTTARENAAPVADTAD